MKTIPKWKEFEVAVSTFVQKLDPSAKVTHDAKLPDRHTGKKRQRDVWIETKALGHFPIRILVSCKRYSRPIHEQDIDHFAGELSSTNANKGVLYSYTGFGKDALENAKARDISCCRLYENQPADMPESLIIGRQYCCVGQFVAEVHNAPSWSLVEWKDLFLLRTRNPSGVETSVLEVIVEEYARGEEAARKTSGKPESFFPQNWKRQTRLEDPAGERPALTLTVGGEWAFFANRLEAVLLNGSYSVTDNQFVGSQMGPVIDIRGMTPGPGWELLTARPRDDDRSCLLITFPNENLKEDLAKLLMDQLAPKSLSVKRTDCCSN